jgi:hypothetical protein
MGDFRRDRFFADTVAAQLELHFSAPQQPFFRSLTVFYKNKNANLADWRFC